MIKRTVLTSLLSLISLFGNYSQARAISIWDIIFQAPSLARTINDHQEDIIEYAVLFKDIKDDIVLSAQDAAADEKDSAVNSPLQVADDPPLTNTPTPSIVPTSKPASLPTATKAPISTSGGPTSYILDQINRLRISHGLAPASIESKTCQFAKQRARELAGSFDHSGFEQRKNAGTLPYPSWSNVTENISMNSDHRGVFDQWRSSGGHTQNMLADTTYICVGKYGNFYAMEGWKP